MGGSTAIATTGGATARVTATLPAATGGSTALSTSTGATGGKTTIITTPKGGATSGGSAGSTAHVPTPPSATAKFPFPQNRQSSNCVYPASYSNDDVKALYTKWKADLVTADGAGAGNFRVKRPKEPGLEVNSSVSEGIAYGMIIAVYMDDQTLFDGLWKYWLSHTWTYVPVGGGGGTPTNLMNWYILADGNPGTQNGKPSLGAATDADEDAAWALVMADRQWGGKGTLSKTYLQSAKDLLADIWKYEILDGKLPKNGSGWGDWKDLNISYFAPSEYRVFAKVSGEAGWLSGVVPTVYETIKRNLTEARGNQANGLVPAWSNSDGGDITATDRPKHYQYDSCRTPFRIGIDFCLNGEPLAKDYVAKTSSFFSKEGASKISTGYELNGTKKPEFAGLSSSFVGPAGVGAMHSATYQTFVNDVYALIKANDMNVGGLYYDESWAMMTILFLTGNYLDYTAY
jgi:endo-1,4-beta-D-glucanase Y